jgi:hypothetical protein
MAGKSNTCQTSCTITTIHALLSLTSLQQLLLTQIKPNCLHSFTATLPQPVRQKLLDCLPCSVIVPQLYPAAATAPHMAGISKTYQTSCTIAIHAHLPLTNFQQLNCCNFAHTHCTSQRLMHDIT